MQIATEKLPKRQQDTLQTDSKSNATSQLPSEKSWMGEKPTHALNKLAEHRSGNAIACTNKLRQQRQIHTQAI
jgi:hypothetical protein